MVMRFWVLSSLMPFRFLFLSLLISSFSALAEASSGFLGTYIGAETITRGICTLHVFTNDLKAAEVMFIVTTAKDEMIHMEVLTLEARPYTSALSPDFDRTADNGQTLLRDETYDHYDYTALRRRQSTDGISFTRSKHWRRTKITGETTFESRATYNCPLLIKVPPTSAGAAKSVKS